MPNYITADEVREASGAPTTLISDSEINGFIDFVEPEMERWLNTRFEPTETIMRLDGTGSNRFFVERNPLLSVRDLYSDDNQEDVSTLEIYFDSGKVSLGTDSDSSIFVEKQNSIVCKYIYGMVIEDFSITAMANTNAETAATSVTIEVPSTTGFTNGDWIKISGMDGNQEVCKITALVADTSITVDEIVFDHEASSRIVKMIIPDYIRRYMVIEAAIAVAINAIGATYTFNASYNLPELSVVKGVPYTHWRESYDKLIKERKMRKDRIKPRPLIMTS